MQVQFQRSMKEREEMQAKLLISEQMIDNFKNKETEMMSEFEEKTRELVNQLDLKEYMLQSVQHKYDKAEQILLKYAVKEIEIKMFLKNMKSDGLCDSPQKISNLVEEVEEQNKELAIAKKRIEELEINQHDLVTLNNQLKFSLNEIQVLGDKMTYPGGKKGVPALDLTKVRRPGNKPITETGYAHKLEESIKLLSKRVGELEFENRELLQKNMQFQNANGSLLKLNTTLSQTLQEIREKNTSLAAKRVNAVHEGRNKSTIISYNMLATSPGGSKKGSKKSVAVQLRNVTEYSLKWEKNERHATEENEKPTGYPEIKDEPYVLLKRGKCGGVEEKKVRTIDVVEKDQSFGETPDADEMDKNVNAGGEGDFSAKLSKDGDPHRIIPAFYKS